MVNKEMPSHSCTNAHDLWEGEGLVLANLEQGFQAPSPQQSKQANTKGKAA